MIVLSICLGSLILLFCAFGLVAWVTKKSAESEQFKVKLERFQDAYAKVHPSRKAQEWAVAVIAVIIFIYAITHGWGSYE